MAVQEIALQAEIILFGFRAWGEATVFRIGIL